jgi:hypothetical protein
LGTGSIYSLPPDTEEQITAKIFFDNPFIENNIIVPHYEYKSYDELFSKLGEPIDEFLPNNKTIYYEGNYLRGFVYEYYNIYTVYTASKDTVYVYLIEFTKKINIKYNFGIKFGDTIINIQNIFGTNGEKYQSVDNDITFLEYTTAFLTTEHIRFVFIKNALEEILLFTGID